MPALLLTTLVLTSANTGLLIIDAHAMGAAAASRRLKAQLSKASGSTLRYLAPRRLQATDDGYAPQVAHMRVDYAPKIMQPMEMRDGEVEPYLRARNSWPQSATRRITDKPKTSNPRLAVKTNCLPLSSHF
eukprot:gene32280-16847_t